MNYKEHNEEVRKVWETFEQGNPIRMPMMAGTSPRFFLLDPKINYRKKSFQEYTEDPDLMFEMQAEFDRYKRLYVMGDHEMGYPEKDGGWLVNIDLQNYYEAAWFGSEVKYPEKESPYPAPFLNEDNKELLFEKGIPDPFSGIFGMARDYYEHFMERKKDYLLDGYPVKQIGTPFQCTDGPFTIACDLFGAAMACTLLLEEPEYMQELFAFLTEATIQRIRAWRRYLGTPELTRSFTFADDSIMLLSPAMYRECVLPWHKKLAQGISTLEKPGMVHLCGDATRHYKVIATEMKVGAFDTGYPVKHGELARELGPEIAIYGGPTVEFLRTSTPEKIREEARRIIEEVKPYTKKFVLRDANNMAPGTPLENIAALHEAAKLYGTYE